MGSSVILDGVGWLERVQAEERRGELLTAVDLAERGLAEHPRDIALQHRSLLALARAGATDEAARRYAAFGLESIADTTGELLFGARAGAALLPGPSAGVVDGSVSCLERR